MTIYTFKSYRPIIEQKIADHAHIKAYRSLLAKAAGCQRTYLSQVLHGHVQLTPDHGAGMARYWGLSQHETQYFLDLILWERAASSTLKSYLHQRLEEARQRQKILAIEAPRLHDQDTEIRYYSSWHYAALHVLASIPGYRTATTMAKALRLPRRTVERRLTSLAQMGLLQEQDGQWQVTEHSIHLPPSSPLNAINHYHWRQRALARLDEEPDKGLHYSALHALSRADAERIRLLILETIGKTRAMVEPSPEETMVSFTLDFYELLGEEDKKD